MPDENEAPKQFATGERPLEDVIRDLDPEQAKEERYRQWRLVMAKMERMKGLNYCGEAGVTSFTEFLEFTKRATEEDGTLPPPRPAPDLAIRKIAAALIRQDSLALPPDDGQGVAVELKRRLGIPRGISGHGPTPPRIVQMAVETAPELLADLTDAQRLWALRAFLANLISPRALHRGRLDGVALQRLWRQLLASSRQLFPEHLDRAIATLAIKSPNGEIDLGRETPKLAAALLMPGGTLVSWLLESAHD